MEFAGIWQFLYFNSNKYTVLKLLFSIFIDISAPTLEKKILNSRTISLFSVIFDFYITDYKL